MLNDANTRKARKRTFTMEDSPDVDFSHMNIEVSREPSGNYRLEAVGLSREGAKAAAKYILGTR